MSMSSVLRGSQTPRIGHFPAYESSAGESAIRFAEVLRIPLDEWQQFVIRHGLGEVADPYFPGQKIWASQDVGLMVPRQNGKSYIIDVLILAGLFLFDKRIILTAQKKPNAKKIFLRIKKLIEESDPAWGLWDYLDPDEWLTESNGYECIRTKRGAFLEIVARGKNARGDSIDWLIHDEAYDLTETDEAALSYALSASPNPQTWYLSTPPLDAVSGEPFKNLRKRGIEKDEGVCWLEWSVDPDKPLKDVLDDREAWAQANPAMNVRIRESTIRSERAKDKEGKSFGRERLGIWPVEAVNSFIKPEAWSAVKDEESKRVGDIALAVDTCGWGDDEMTSIALYGIREDGLGHVEIIDQRPGTDWVLKRLVELKEKHKDNLVAIGFDRKSPIDSILIDLQKVGFKVPDNPEEPEYGDLAIPSERDFSPACVQFVAAVNQKTFRHRGQTQLNNAVTAGKARKIFDSWGWDRYKSPGDISPLVAATLARWAYETRAHLVQNDYDVMSSFYFGGD